MAISKYRVLRGKRDERLHINMAKHQTKGVFAAYQFTDRDTNQIVIYIPSLEVSGYGETVEKASEMVNSSIHDYFVFLFTLPPLDIRTELSKHGWKQGLFKKDFSRLYVNENGTLKNLNAVDDKVERVSLIAA